MITKYFTKVSVKFDPFTASSRSARLFLARIPPSMKGACKIDYKVLTANSPVSEKPIVEVTFKDKHIMKADPEEMNFKDLSVFFDSHSRQLAIKEAISD